MDLDFLIKYVEWGVQYAQVYGLLLIVLLMFLESSLLPIPSEVILIPAGFMAARGEFTTGIPYLDFLLIVIFGGVGALLASYFNYYLGKWLGKPILHRYGKYIFLKEQTLDLAEKKFKTNGAFAVFVCRLIPALRQIISIPAGISEMPIKIFTILSFSGSLIWSFILTILGFVIGLKFKNMGYRELINMSEKIINENFYWLIIFLIFCGIIFIIYKLIIKNRNKAGK